MEDVILNDFDQNGVFELSDKILSPFSNSFLIAF